MKLADMDLHKLPASALVILLEAAMEKAEHYRKLWEADMVAHEAYRKHIQSEMEFWIREYQLMREKR